MISGLISTPGYQRAQQDELQLHTRLVVFHRGLIWELRCSARNDMADFQPLETEAPLAEQAALGFFLLWRSIAATMQQATTRLCAELCQSSKGGLRHDR